jgi:chromosome segregation ATPase
MRENTEQIIQLASNMEHVTEELHKIPALSNALNSLERTVALYQQRLEALDRDFREFRRDQREKKNTRGERTT